MTLLIQRTEHRDTQALQAKLDELLHAHSQANNALTKIDEPEDIVRHRTRARSAELGSRKHYHSQRARELSARETVRLMTGSDDTVLDDVRLTPSLMMFPLS
jgi:low affinity Fe/Cu permease